MIYLKSRQRIIIIIHYCFTSQLYLKISDQENAFFSKKKEKKKKKKHCWAKSHTFTVYQSLKVIVMSFMSNAIL